MITRHPKNILLADDSVFFRTKLSAILIEAGHKVRVASDGVEVLREMESEKNAPDLLVLDLKMPNVDGFKVLETMQEKGLNKKTRTLAITGVYEPSAVVDKLKGLGAAGLVTKGISPEQLLFRINHILFPEKIAEKGSDRVPVSLHAYFSAGDAAHTGFILNISPTGLFIHTEAPLSLGEEIDIDFKAHEDGAAISITGVVQWITPASEVAGIFSGAGIVFTSVSPQSRAAIDILVKEAVRKSSNVSY